MDTAFSCISGICLTVWDFFAFVNTARGWKSLIYKDLAESLMVTRAKTRTYFCECVFFQQHVPARLLRSPARKSWLRPKSKKQSIQVNHKGAQMQAIVIPHTMNRSIVGRFFISASANKKIWACFLSRFYVIINSGFGRPVKTTLVIQ